MAFMKGDYFDAAALYKKAFTKEKNKAKKAEIIFKTAECYRMTNDVKNQEVWYLKALKANVKEPEAIVRYADALKASGKYSEAIVQYQKFITASPGDKRGEIGVRTCEQAQKWKDKPTRARIDNLAAVNTKYNDFGAAYSKKDHRSIIFTSSRQEAMGKANDGGTGEKFQELFEATVDKKGKWSTPRALIAPLNSEANDGAAFLDSKGNEMYFTRCEVEKGVYGICQVYFTVRKADSWEEPKLIKLAADSFTVGQPCLSSDGNQLYFVSDMKGGIGGKDIYVCDYDKNRKEWGAPRNLGPVINTPTDDMFPFLTSENTLYFSSKGHMGMGGLDIFRAKRAGNSWKTPENLKYPINTSFDDFAYVLDELNPEKGFLSSNRPSGKGGDDIYSWYLAPLTFTISGRVYDLDTKEPLAGTSIELFGSDGSSIPFKTDATGNYKFDLKPETKYKLSASQKTYLNKYLEVSTVGLEQSKDFIGDFDFALRSTLRAIELPEVYYDLAKWDLRPESKKSLDGLVQILTENPTITIELGSHTDSRPIPMTNDTLSQRRAESVVAYLIKAGIQPERLVAKGYGATQPRTLDKDRGSFKKGDRLDDAFINGLATKELKEQAHQLNRRTEFRVLKTNYMDPSSATEIVQETAPAPVVSTDTPVKVEVQEAPKAEEKSGPGEIHYCKKSETYNSIAKQYSITVKDLKTLNGIKTEQIFEGMELKVELNGDYTEYDKQFYVLEKGDDSFKTIAKKLNMKEGDLKKLNKGMSDVDFRPGRRIRISGK
jgi:peptidoglycan-associated lipoprotein